MQVKQRGFLSLSPSRLRRAAALVFCLAFALALILVRGRFQVSGGAFLLGPYLLSFALVFAGGFLIAFDLQLPGRAGPAFCILSMLLYAFPLLYMMELFDTNPIANIVDWALWFNLFLIWLICWGLYSVFGRFNTALRAGSVFFYLLGLINSAVRLFRGTPISALDLYSIRTAAAVSNRYRYPFDYYFFVSTLLLIFLFLLAGNARWKPQSRAGRWAGRGAWLACTLAFAAVFSNTALLNRHGIKDYQWNQNLAFQDNGLLLSVIYSFRYLFVETPAGYSPERVQQIIDTAPAAPAVEQAGQKPNLIVIMNESLADLSAVGSFETDTDYLPFLRSLAGQPNTITGQLAVSTFGGGTCNTEFEFLTGNTLAFFPSGSMVYQQYIRSELPSLATVLKEQGYSAYAVHPFYNYCWNRSKVYPLLGFERFYDLSDFSGARMIGSFVDNCVSDGSDFEKLIELYEQKPAGQPLFLFNVTMQNHGGYSSLINRPDETVHFEKDGYTSSYADNYLSLIKATDTAFSQLIDYFSEASEPTIILMFGDHQPNLPDFIYEQLFGKPLSELTLAESQQRFLTPFVLWANYPIAGGGQDAGLMGANYLSTLLLRTAGLKTTPYQDYLTVFSQQVPAINLNGYYGADGKAYSFEEESPYTDLLEEYRALQYNYMIDKGDRIESIFSVGGE